jgi:hypothetical protein
MMTITGPLTLGAAQIISRATGELLGYAFAVPNGAGQLQRWLLYRDPQNSFDIQPPPPNMAGWALSDWQAHVPSLWRPGSFYVWAQADVYRHGGSYTGPSWTQIPPADQLPSPTYPDLPGADFQLDHTRTHLLNLLHGQSRGLAYSVGSLSNSSSAEYWMLPSGYTPGGDSGTTSITTGSDAAASLAEFVGVANRSWGPGCCLAIVGCVNYRGENAPAMP